MDIEFPLKMESIETRYGDASLWGTSRNKHLDRAAVEFMKDWDELMQFGIESGVWEEREGKAYKKLSVGEFGVKGLDVPGEPELQMADVYIDPDYIFRKSNEDFFADFLQ